MLGLQHLLLKVKKSYVLSLLLVLLLLSGAFITLKQCINDQKNDASLINIAGKQRMLSQKLSLSVYRYKESLLTGENIASYANKIIMIVNQLKSNHHQLISGSEPLLVNIRGLFFQSVDPLHQRIMQFSDNAIKIAQTKNVTDVNFYIQLEMQEQQVEDLLERLDFIVKTMETESTKNIDAIEKAIMILWLLTLLFLAFFTYFAFKRISTIVSESYLKLRKEKNKVADFEYAINKHSIVFRVSLKHKIQYVNEKFCQLYGFSQQEILGQHQSVLGSDEHPKALFDEMHDHINRGEVWKHELCNMDAKGWKYWLDTTVVPISHRDKVISYMVIQNEITEQKQMSFALGAIHSVIADPKLSLRDKAQQLLALGCEFFHLPFGIISEISEDTYTIKYAQSPNNELAIGATFDVDNTYCIHTLLADKPIAFDHVGESEIKNHPCYESFGLESYIGCPIVVDGERYGTLNFSSPDVHSKPFSSNDLELIQLISQWIANELLREKNQQKMISQNTLMEEMSHQGRIGAWEVDLVNNKATWSDVTKEIHEVPLDYQPDLATAINFYKEGESRDNIVALVEKAIEDGIPFETESELLTAKGNSIWVASHGKAKFENGQCVKIYGSFQDISEKKKIAQEMIDKNRRMNLAADSAGIGVWEFNILNNELSWDDWMFRLYGVEKTAFSGAYEAWENGLHPDDKEKSAQALQLAIEGKQKFDTQFRIIKPNGDIRYIKAAAIVLRDKVDEPHTMVGVNYDITDRVETELALTQAKELAEQASKVKNEFLASMSHEIRTPMNGVVGMLDLLADSDLEPSQKHQVAVAKSSADSLLFLINDILDFSKIDANKLELEKINFDINTLLSECADALMQQAEHKGLELIVDSVAVIEPLIVGDPNRIRQIITNLVSNAIKFTHQGEVLITLALIPDDAANWRLRISVKDTGIGISKANQRHLFESFNQVDSSTTRKFGGTGLGLAIVKKLCQCMDGDVSLMSDEGQGSLFICDVKVGKSSQVTPLMPSVDLKNFSVLVVDDNQTNREVLSKQLTSWQIMATCVDSAEAALNLCMSRVELSRPLFDVVIVDMQMPGMDGAQFAKTLRADIRFNVMKLVMMTSMNAQGDAKLFAGLGFSAYFPKPATSSDLFNALNIIADDGLALSNADPLITKHYIKSLNKAMGKQDEQTISWPDNSKVLLVEDNRVNQMVAKGVLNKIGMPCEVAINGQEALDKLSQDHSFSLILMDCQMPVMDGYQATEQIRQGQAGNNNIGIPIVAMTANAMQGDREKCLAAGMNDYLTKPIDKDLVLEKLTYWLKQQ